MSTLVPSFDHLLRLTDGTGIFEHAQYTTPRVEHGYCTDDVARALLVVAREPDPSPYRDIERTYLDFLGSAQRPGGLFANRLSIDREWVDDVRHDGTHDATGRARWALGTVAGRRSGAVASAAFAMFDRGTGFASEHPRASAFAILGACEVLEAHPDHAGATALVRRSVGSLGTVRTDPAWPWPEERLSYANAAIPDALLAAGVVLGDGESTSAGLDLLRWLVEVETLDGHFSFTPVGGWGASEPRPGFDQQPIEAAAMADACARAYALTGDPSWATAVHRAAAWFLGANDSGTLLADPTSGGGHDGLTATGRNENQGAESTIALISTLQQAWRLGPAATDGRGSRRAGHAPSPSAPPAG
jgi:hypothetical protein